MEYGYPKQWLSPFCHKAYLISQESFSRWRLLVIHWRPGYLSYQDLLTNFISNVLQWGSYLSNLVYWTINVYQPTISAGISGISEHLLQWFVVKAQPQSSYDSLEVGVDSRNQGFPNLTGHPFAQLQPQTAPLTQANHKQETLTLETAEDTLQLPRGFPNLCACPHSLVQWIHDSRRGGNVQHCLFRYILCKRSATTAQDTEFHENWIVCVPRETISQSTREAWLWLPNLKNKQANKPTKQNPVQSEPESQLVGPLSTSYVSLWLNLVRV